MNSWNLPDEPDCPTFRRWIDAFLADEVAAAPRRKLEAHLERCDECARRLEVERGLVTALRRRLGGLAESDAPPGLETRIRAALDAEAGRSARAGGSPFAWLRTPWFAAVAASLLLAVLVVPDLTGPDRSGFARVLGMERDVMVVDLDCDRAGKSIEAQRRCRLRHHLNALKLADGSYVYIALHREDDPYLLTEPDRRGALLHVKGDYYPALQTLRVRSARELARDTL
jgi:hypothetical protein